MTTLALPLPEEIRAFIEDEVAREGHASASEYLIALLREAQKRRARQALDAKLLEGLQGPSVEMTRDDWDSLRREALEGLDGEELRP